MKGPRIHLWPFCFSLLSLWCSIWNMLPRSCLCQRLMRSLKHSNITKQAIRSLANGPSVLNHFAKNKCVLQEKSKIMILSRRERNQSDCCGSTCQSAVFALHYNSCLLQIFTSVSTGTELPFVSFHRCLMPLCFNENHNPWMSRFALLVCFQIGISAVFIIFKY